MAYAGIEGVIEDTCRREEHELVYAGIEGVIEDTCRRQEHELVYAGIDRIVYCRGREVYFFSHFVDRY